MTSRLPPFKSIEAFVVAAQCLSFTSAASVLCITVPGVSRRIKALEAELGIVLFQRMHRALRLTPAGQRYFERLRPAIAAIRDASESVRSVPRASTVKLSVPPSFAANWLFPRLPRFQAAHGAIEIVLDTPLGDADFDRSDVDLAIRLGRGNWPDLHVRPLLDVVAFPVCTRTLIARGQAMRGISDLLKYPLMSASDQPELWHDVLATYGVAAPTNLRHLRFETCNLLYEAAVNGLGVAMGLDVLVEPYLEAGRLIRPLDHIRHVPPERFYLVCRDQDRDHWSVRTLAAWLMDEAAKWRSCASVAVRLTEPPQSAIVLAPAPE